MKALCASALILIASLGWAATPAKAQDRNYSSALLPWPNAAPVAAQTGYQTAPTPASPGTPSPMTGFEGQGPQPQSDLDAALHAPCCETCDEFGCTCRNWYVFAAALAMGRSRANPYWTTYQTNNNPNQLMNTQNAGADWAAGGQITLGYAWCGACGPSLAFTYWGLSPMEGFSSVVDQTGNINTALSTPIDLNNVTMNNGDPASLYFDNAHEQRIWRRDIVNNFEVNALTGIYQVGNLQMAALAGFRYFRFAEDLTYGSVMFGSTFGANGGADEAYLRFNCINNLYGGQVGALVNAMLTDDLSFFFIPKFGIFSNQMNCQTLLYTGDAVNNPTYNIAGHKTDVALLAELDSGFSWTFRDGWRAFIGYRVVGVNNLALADNQFLPFLADTQGFSEVKQNGSLILHGAFAGLGWMF
jgi:hypothetical protein